MKKKSLLDAEEKQTNESEPSGEFLPSEFPAELEFRIYLHLFEDERVFLLPLSSETEQDKPMDLQAEGLWCNLDELEPVINEMQELPEIVLFSCDEQADRSPLAELFVALQIQLAQVDPHPAITGYNRSFRPFIADALDAAVLDIEGTEALLADAREELEQAELGSDEFVALEESVKSFEQQLSTAKRAYEKLQAFELEFCIADGEYEH